MRIKEIRESMDMSQGELARRAGLAQATVHYIESGTNNPTYKNLKKIAEVLGVSVDSLMDESQKAANE